MIDAPERQQSRAHEESAPEPRQDPRQEIRQPRKLENISADIPENLRDADELLRRYGRWATTSGRGGGAHTLERQYLREADRKEALNAFERRREAAYGQATKDPMMMTADALIVQRALARVPDRERVVLAILYVPRRIPPHKQFEILHIPPRISRDRHVAGLRMFWNLHRIVASERPTK